jgi:hypothetical protein
VIQDLSSAVVIVIVSCYRPIEFFDTAGNQNRKLLIPAAN